MKGKGKANLFVHVPELVDGVNFVVEINQGANFVDEIYAIALERDCFRFFFIWIFEDERFLLEIEEFPNVCQACLMVNSTKSWGNYGLKDSSNETCDKCFPL